MRNKKDLVSGLRVLEMRSGVLARCPLRGDGYYQETISRLNHDLLGALRAGARPKS